MREGELEPGQRAPARTFRAPGLLRGRRLYCVRQTVRPKAVPAPTHEKPARRAGNEIALCISSIV